MLEVTKLDKVNITTMARLPQLGGDENTWGSVLNDFLEVSLNTDGTVKDGAVNSSALQDGSVSGVKLQSGSIGAGKLDAGSGSNGDVLTKNASSVGGFVWAPTPAGTVDSVNGQTGTVMLDADDIDDTSSANKYTTSADITRLANTSGTNTGDQDLSGYVPTTTTVNGHALSANVSVTAADIGLGNVNNTSDANKPVSTAQQTALDAKAATTVTNALDVRVTTLESAGIVTLTDGATIATDASAGKHFRVAVAGDRTLAAPTGAADGMRRLWEVTASGAQRVLTLATGTAGSFELTVDLSAAITIASGNTHFIGAVYNASRQRWSVLASKALM
jgi:hypothetical protein